MRTGGLIQLVVLWACLIVRAEATDENDTLYVVDAQRHGVYSVELSENGQENRLPVPLQTPVAVASDITSGDVYMTERGRDSMTSQKYIIRWDGGQQSVAKVELPRWSIPDGLAVDPLSHLIYYSDAFHAVIGVFTSDLHHGRVVITDSLGSPRGLALDPVNGLLFWTDWQSSRPHIGRANMDGSNQTVIVTTDITFPNGLTFDTTEGQLYWCDASRDVIERCQADGSARHLVYKIPDVSHCFGIAVDDHYIYWTDWTKTGVQRIAKNGTGPVTTLGPHRELEEVRMMGVALGGTGIPINGTNACSGAERGGCAHICVPSAGSRTCLCDEGFKLGTDNTSCHKLEFRTGLIVADIGRKELMTFDLFANASQRVAHADGHGTLEAVAYDPIEQYVFWVDSGLKKVVRACFFNASCATLTLLSHPHSRNSRMVGIALDPERKQVYVADQGQHLISRMDYDGGSQTFLHILPNSQPTGIAMDPVNRMLYWSECCGIPRIMWSADGSRRGSVLISDVSSPKALVLDIQGGRLYWVDTDRKTLESALLNGTDHLTVTEFTNRHTPSALTMGGGSLYWAFNNDRSIHALDLASYTTKTYRSDAFRNIVSMVFFHRGGPPNIAGEINTGHWQPPTTQPISDEEGNLVLLLVLSGVALVIVSLIVGTIVYRRKRKRRAPPQLPMLPMLTLSVDDYLHSPPAPPSESGLSVESDNVYAEIADLKARPLPALPSLFLDAATPTFPTRSPSPIPPIPSAKPSPIPPIPSPKPSPSSTPKSQPKGTSRSSGKHPVPLPRGVKKQESVPGEEGGQKYMNLQEQEEKYVNNNQSIETIFYTPLIP